jgi:curved DNA-binding protein CbpA
MKTLYDLLDAHPDDDAEALRAAYRRAAKANHPDLHAGDRYAAIRFRQIAEAYEILRDGERRATYDRLLKLERERLRWSLRSTVSYLVRSIVSDAVTAVGFAIVLAGGYMIFAHVSKTSVGDLVGIPTRGAARIAAVQPAAPTSMNKPDDRRERLEGAVGHNQEPATGGSAPKTGVNAEVAKIANAVSVNLDRAGAKTTAGHPDQNVGTEVLDRDSAQSVTVLSSSAERDDGAGKLSSSDFAMSDDKHDTKGSDGHDVNTSDIKISDTKIHGRPRIAAKRLATSHSTFEQASLENKSTCSGSCSRDVPPLFGVGF